MHGFACAEAHGRPYTIRMYKLAVPHPDLLPFVEHYWSVSVNPGEVVDLSVNVYVDARADLIFNFGDPYMRGVVGRRPVTCSVSNLDAQRNVPITIVQRGEVATIGVRFRTGGLSPFVLEPVSRFTNRTPGIKEVFGESAARMEASLSERRSDMDGQKEQLDSFLLDRMRLDAAYATFSGVMAEIETNGGLEPVGEVSRRASISPRNLGRMFDRYLGFSPKSLARIVRFQRALRILMNDTKTSLGTVSAECGYFDQSHFVKDFRRFTGGVPRGYKGYYPPEVPADFAPNVVRFLQDGGKG
jgi:AraC-like DNA-binding protein